MVVSVDQFTTSVQLNWTDNHSPQRMNLNYFGKPDRCRKVGVLLKAKCGNGNRFRGIIMMYMKDVS